MLCSPASPDFTPLRTPLESSRSSQASQRPGAGAAVLPAAVFSKRVRRYCPPTKRLFIKTLYFRKPFTGDTLQAPCPSGGSRREAFGNSEGFPEEGECQVLNQLPTKGCGGVTGPLHCAGTLRAEPGPAVGDMWGSTGCISHSWWKKAGALRGSAGHSGQLSAGDGQKQPELARGALSRTWAVAIGWLLPFR